MITKPDGIDTDDKVEETISTILNVLRSKIGGDDDQARRCSVDIISLRFVDKDRFQEQDGEDRLKKARFLRVLRSVVPPADECGCAVVVNGYENAEMGMAGLCHGVHLREREAAYLKELRERWAVDKKLNSDRYGRILIGLSVHSVDVACESVDFGDRPDYFLVGTAFPTLSHPEKVDSKDFEGPELAGLVKKKIIDKLSSKNQSDSKLVSPPLCISIGGMNASNCHIPMVYGADGVAVIGAISTSKEPGKAAWDLRQSMKSAMN
eukprot:CAMPEP_0194273082 /NCGR_PEP_ID=MMETSP0169-20130528/6496_1 /TAXON_ID=218684 /ORGANISM="Corethron pennatum, Strain L29A3" /LENGTH=264 /DNA_ID=CAMNT_0039015923 /DNA_START=264 /DNA_END=1058 /DNA_ORIENTATION=-